MDEIQPLTFFFESHIPVDAVKELRRLGVNIVRAIEAGFPIDEPDPPLLDYATEKRMILVSCDEEFVNEHNLVYLEAGKEHGGIIFISMRNNDCKDIGKIVRVILYFHEQVMSGKATYEEDLYNELKYTYHL